MPSHKTVFLSLCGSLWEDKLLYTLVPAARLFSRAACLAISHGTGVSKSCSRRVSFWDWGEYDDFSKVVGLVAAFGARVEIIFAHILVFPACAIEVQHINENSPTIFIDMFAPKWASGPHKLTLFHSWDPCITPGYWAWYLNVLPTSGSLIRSLSYVFMPREGIYTCVFCPPSSPQRRKPGYAALLRIRGNYFRPYLSIPRVCHRGAAYQWKFSYNFTCVLSNYLTISRAFIISQN